MGNIYTAIISNINIIDMATNHLDLVKYCEELELRLL